MDWAQLSSTVIFTLLSSISGQVFMVISHLESDLNKKTYKKLMFLKKSALWANAKKSHRDFSTIESIKVTLHFGYTLKFFRPLRKATAACQKWQFSKFVFQIIDS
jgi:hypothetical protein